MQKKTVLGLMSGTSLDGLDIACVQFVWDGENYRFELLKGATIDYPIALKELLIACRSLSNDLLIELHLNWAEFAASAILKQFPKTDFDYDLIASHGHTVFHEPENSFTLQIGSCAILSKLTATDVVGDFRSRDVSMGGQGAPLVPIGDLLLFKENNAWLNLGGIANITVNSPEVSAFDICPCNLVLNHYSEQLGSPYDAGGAWAREGELNEPLLQALNNLLFYEQHQNKSLGVEQVEAEFIPLIDSFKLPVKTVLNTYCHHIAHCVWKAVKSEKPVLVTGGGAYNAYLVSCMKEKGVNIDLPHADVVDFKEAIVFAFLGLRNWEGKVNVLNAVTGSSSDHVGGQYFSFSQG